MASNKAMSEWNDNEVKNWINSLTSLNDKQKQLICNGVDSIGCDGDSLACAETAEELKDALEIPIILARKLIKAVKDHLNKGSNNNNNNNQQQQQQQQQQQSNTNSNTNSNQNNTNQTNTNQNSNKILNANNNDANKKGEVAESEEDVLARLIARNLAAKKTQAPQQAQAAPMGMGMNMNNMGIGGLNNQQQQQNQMMNNNQNNNSGVKSLFTWGQQANNNNMMNQGSGDFKINIQGSNGKLISLNQKCNKHTKIKQVKQMLASQEGGDPAKMVMKYNGRTMDDAQNLGFYGIADSRNLITVTFKVVGGN